MQVLSLFFYSTLVDLHYAQDDTPMCVGGALCGAMGVVFGLLIHRKRSPFPHKGRLPLGFVLHIVAGTKHTQTSVGEGLAPPAKIHGFPRTIRRGNPLNCRDRQMFAKQTLNFACEVSPTTVQGEQRVISHIAAGQPTLNIRRAVFYAVRLALFSWTVGDAGPYKQRG